MMKVSLFGLGLLSLMTTQAFAYIPPSGYLMRTLEKKHALVKWVRVKTQVTSTGSDTSLNFKTNTVYNSLTGELISWASDDSDKVLYHVDHRESALSPGAIILFGTRLALDDEALIQAGIPIKMEADLMKLPDETARQAAETEQLLRWKDGFSWVIGALDSSQLWFEKDGFLPIRLRLNGKDGKGWDAQFENYRTHREFPFPQLINLFSRTNVGIFKEETREVGAFTSDPKPQDLKDLKDFKEGTPGFTDAGNSSSSALRELIETYYGILR